MATNRLFLTCVRCKDEFSIARLQVGMDGEWLPARVSLTDYELWLGKHSTECGYGLAVELTCENEIALFGARKTTGQFTQPFAHEVVDLRVTVKHLERVIESSALAQTEPKS